MKLIIFDHFWGNKNKIFKWFNLTNVDYAYDTHFSSKGRLNLNTQLSILLPWLLGIQKINAHSTAESEKKRKYQNAVTHCKTLAFERQKGGKLAA